MNNRLVLTEILKIENLKKYYIKKKIFSSDSSIVKATDRISFSIKKGEVFVLAGESGSGKSTIAKLILKAIPADEGKIIFEDQEIDEQKKNLQKIRMNCQMIHQDPYDSINPRMKIKDIILEPLEIHNVGNKEERHRRLLEVLKEVKLEPVEEIMKKYPHMLSGGQRQRIVIARAIVVKPEIIIADEPVSMLDVSIRAEVLELMKEIQNENNISMIYITHDLATAKHFADDILILKSGKVMEIGTVEKVLSDPENAYTKALISAISEPNPKNLYKEKKILFE